MKRVLILKWLVIACILILFISCSSDDGVQNTSSTITTNDISLTVDENPLNNAVIGQVPGVTSAGTLEFTILSQIPSFSIKLDINTGMITVRDSTNFNYEINTEVTATAKITNGEVTKHSFISIKINDVYEKYSYIGNVVLQSQQQVDAFGYENHWGVSGIFQISNSQGNIVDLSPIESVKNVGSLFISNLNINTLDDFNNIDEVKNSIRITNNSMLQNLEGLSNSLTSGKDIQISENHNLLSLQGLPNFESIAENLIIRYNYNLTSLNGISSIESIAGDFFISNNNNLTTLNGISNINNVSGDLTIKLNNQLNDITALSGLNVVGGKFTIHQNDFLSSLSGIQNITLVGDNLSITNQIFLTEINALSNLQNVVGDLRIINNPQLYNLCGIENLIINNGLEGDYFIEDNVYNPTIQDIIDGNCSN